MTEPSEPAEPTGGLASEPTGGLASEPTGGPASEPTGEPAVDAVLARLTEADGVPLHRQADLYEELHRALHDTLDPPNS